MSWYEYRLIFEPGADIDSILYLLLEYGFEGSYEETPLDIFETDDGYGYREQHNAFITVVTFSQEEVDPVKWEEWFRGMGWARTEKTKAKEQTGEEWKELHKPIFISENIYLIPAWLKGDIECNAAFCLYLEPGAAFGTGLHGTTQDCMRLLEQIVLTGKKILDVGTGSGILSVLALKMGAEKVYAMDCNPSSALEVQKNMEFNGLDSGLESVIGDALTLPFPEVGVILSNIGVKENLELLPKFKQCLEEGGELIVSGIVTWGEEPLINEFSSAGFELAERLATDEWVTAYFRKKERS